MTIDNDADRIDAAKADVAAWMDLVFGAGFEWIDRAGKLADKDAAERARVDVILERDSVEAEAERKRKEAEIEIDDGVFVNLVDTVIPPTPERLAKGNFRSVTIEKVDGTVRTAQTVRESTLSRLTTLLVSGVLDQDTYKACKWYRDTWEMAGLNAGPAISSYSTTPRGEKEFGHLPRSARAAEARHMFRDVQTYITKDVLPIFDLVVIEELSVRDAAKIGRCRYSNADAAFRRGALQCFEGARNYLPVTQTFHDID